MSKLLTLALIQQHASEDLADNLRRGVAAFEEAAQKGAQVIAFAELAFTPFYPQNPASDKVLELAESIPGPTTDIFSELSKKHSVVTILNLL